MTNHTPTPWTAEDNYVFADKDCIAICDTNNASAERYQANAALIARAVNAHEELVNELQKTVYFLRRVAEHIGDDMPGHAGNCSIVVKSIEVALAKAKGE